VERQKLLAEQTTLTRDVQTLQEQLNSVESLNQLHEATIIEQKNHIDKLLVECKQVKVWFGLSDCRVDCVKEFVYLQLQQQVIW